jgi:CAAX protease family protein
VVALTERIQTARRIPLRRVVPVYLSAIVAAEALVAYGSPLAGILIDAVVVFVGLNQYLIERDRLDASGPLRAESTKSLDVLLVLPLVPILRICSLTMSVSAVPELWRYVVVGVPVLAAALLTGALGDRRRLIALLHVESRRHQAAIGLTGLPLGLLAYLALRPAPLADSTSPAQIAAGCAILVVFSGLLEELVFRGLLQDAFCSCYGPAGQLVSGALFAAVYLGAGSAAAAVVFAAIGLSFGFAVARTHSLVGVVAAHGLLSIGLVLVWPQVLG